MPFAPTGIATRLPCQDLERARKWYSEKLGLEPLERRKSALRYVVAGCEFALYCSAGHANGTFTQISFSVEDLRATVDELRAKGVVFEEYDGPLATVDCIAEIKGNYPSKGIGERGAWCRDSEGNMIGLCQPVGALAIDRVPRSRYATALGYLPAIARDPEAVRTAAE